MRILGTNALFHDPAATLVVDGRTVAAAEEIGPYAVRRRRAFAGGRTAA
ncbi:hypothetical protein [Streptomyces viridochromogenes]|nr:hypothetical protein [Streptomyces viridochromogenes]